jgi:hypothetical protein
MWSINEIIWIILCYFFIFLKIWIYWEEEEEVEESWEERETSTYDWKTSLNSKEEIKFIAYVFGFDET